ncbi:MAG TPA: sulfatase [Solirubrobacteraceae bacterium]|jgi:arylsulfatase A-like enzyme|nr:sulfatase [Solirubrobacteraceae bacterium]
MLRKLVAAVALGLALAAVWTPAAGAAAPNIVFVLTDDLAWNLVQYMPHVQELQSRGTTFSRFYVSDSLCCPSRSSIFSGRFPHNTKIFTNKSPDGGFDQFHARGEEGSTWATDLQGAGYRTGMMGKYLNGYLPDGLVNGARLYIPPGWNEWDVAGNGYGEFNYNLNQNGQLVHHGIQPQDYLTDVVGGRAVQFINGAADAGQPFALEVATFAPHAPYTPAPRNANDFPGLGAPRTPAFDYQNTDPPRWLSGHAPLTPPQIGSIDTAFRKRAQSVEAVDQLIGNIEATLQARGLADNTYIVFSSDNGYHMGEHRLLPGKMTAFDSDIRVPLMVAGPGVPAGVTTTRIAQNIDLRPTFAEIAGAPVPRTVDGRSLVQLLHGGTPGTWRTGALVEHHGPDHASGDPDLPRPGSGNPATYAALRTKDAVYVEYRNGEREYYSLARDPNELHNTYRRLGHAARTRLHRQLVALTHCHGRTCRSGTANG